MHLIKFCVFTLAASLASSAYALRCGTHLIEKGDGFSRVSKYCGEPTSVQSRSIFRTRGGSQQLPSDSIAFVEVYEQVSVEVEVEEWEYNFGPRRLSRRIIFEDGRVFKIQSLGYGY